MLSGVEETSTTGGKVDVAAIVAVGVIVGSSVSTGTGVSDGITVGDAGISVGVLETESNCGGTNGMNFKGNSDGAKRTVPTMPAAIKNKISNRMGKNLFFFLRLGALNSFNSWGGSPPIGGSGLDAFSIELSSRSFFSGDG